MQMLRRRKAEPIPAPAPARVDLPQIPVWDEAAIEKVANALLGEVITVLAEAPITVHVAVAERLAIAVAAHLSDTGQHAAAIDMLSGLIETAEDARRAIMGATSGTQTKAN
jgi:tetrahydromethanopterin S-methyltransferase subunit C